MTGNPTDTADLEITSSSVLNYTQDSDIENAFIETSVNFNPFLFNYDDTKKTLDKFIQTIIGCPVIIQHKDINKDNANKERARVVSDVWFNDGDGRYYCSGIIWDEKALDLVINKGWSVSCTYDFESNNTKKKYNGQDITQEFTNGKFLHFAIVPDPRYERANIVFNSKTVDNYNENHDGQGKFTSGGNGADLTQHPHDFGQAYAEFSHKTKEAINHLSSVKHGYVPNAVTKEGILILYMGKWVKRVTD